MVSPIFFIFLLLSVRLISCDALCHVVLEVLVEERVVFFIEAGRSEIIGHIGYGIRGVCLNHATSEMVLIFIICSLSCDSFLLDRKGQRLDRKSVV